VELIVVGFHRSGTSLLTQLLHSAGLFVGEELLGAMPSNPYGHFEDRDVLEIHRAIMADNGVSWQVDSPQEFFISPGHWGRMQSLVSRRQTHQVDWGFKEPRVCLFLGAWKYLLPDARFVVVYRDPSECVRSMEQRQFSDYSQGQGNPDEHLRFFREPDHGLRMWEVHNRAVVDFARRHLDDCLVLPYSHLPEGYPVVRAINQRFGSHLREVPTHDVFDPTVAGRAVKPQWVHDPALATRVHETWQELEELAARTEPLR
jgi:hypothetical protein